MWGHEQRSWKVPALSMLPTKAHAFPAIPQLPAPQQQVPLCPGPCSHRLLLPRRRVRKTGATQGPRRLAPLSTRGQHAFFQVSGAPGLADSEPGHGGPSTSSLSWQQLALCLRRCLPLFAPPCASASRGRSWGSQAALWFLCVSVTLQFSLLSGWCLPKSLPVILSDSPLTTRPSVPTTSASPGVHMRCPPWRTPRPNGQRPPLKGEAGGYAGASDLALPLASAVCSSSLTSNLRITRPLAWRPLGPA